MQLCNYEPTLAKKKLKKIYSKCLFVSKHNNSTYLEGYFTSVITRRGGRRLSPPPPPAQNHCSEWGNAQLEFPGLGGCAVSLISNTIIASFNPGVNGYL